MSEFQKGYHYNWELHVSGRAQDRSRAQVTLSNSWPNCHCQLMWNTYRLRTKISCHFCVQERLKYWNPGGIFFYGFPGTTQWTRKSPIALRLILTGSRTDGLTSPPKDTKENLLFHFEVGLSAPRRETNLHLPLMMYHNNMYGYVTV